MPASFRAPEVVALAGITYKQLDWWCRTDLIRPSIHDGRGSGDRRCYSVTDVRIVRTISRLIDAGLTPRAIDQAALVPNLRALDADGWDGWLLIGGGHTIFGVTTAELTAALAELTGVSVLLDLAATAINPEREAVPA